MTKYAKSCFYLIEKEIDNYDKFEELFKKRFWNISIQDGLRRTLNSGAYISNGNLSRVNYAMRLFGIAEDLNIAADSEAIISIIVQHFGIDIKRIVRLQKINTRDDFLEVLQEFDNDDDFLNVKKKTEKKDNRRDGDKRQFSSENNRQNYGHNNQQKQDSYNQPQDSRFPQNQNSTQESFSSRKS